MPMHFNLSTNRQKHHTWDCVRGDNTPSSAGSADSSTIRPHVISGYVVVIILITDSVHRQRRTDTIRSIMTHIWPAFLLAMIRSQVLTVICRRLENKCFHTAGTGFPWNWCARWHKLSSLLWQSCHNTNSETLVHWNANIFSPVRICFCTNNHFWKLDLYQAVGLSKTAYLFIHVCIVYHPQSTSYFRRGSIKDTNSILWHQHCNRNITILDNVNGQYGYNEVQAVSVYNNDTKH